MSLSRSSMTQPLSAEIPLPRGFIDGLILSNNVSDADHDIDIAVGVARDSTNVKNLSLTSAITKRIDAAFAAGTGNGGLDTGSVANSTWYHVWLILKDVDGTIDALFSTSATAPTMPTGYTYRRRLGSVLTNGSANIYGFTQFGNKFLWNGGIDTGSKANSTWYHVWLIMTAGGTVDALFSTSATSPTMPSGYTYKRRIGSVLTDGSGNIIAFTQKGDYFYWATFAEDMATTPTASTVAVTISTPLGVVVQALLMTWYSETTTSRYFYVQNYDEITLVGVCFINVSGTHYGGESIVKTNTSSQIKYVASHASGTAAIRTNGWIDPRGKDAA